MCSSSHSRGPGVAHPLEEDADQGHQRRQPRHAALADQQEPAQPHRRIAPEIDGPVDQAGGEEQAGANAEPPRPGPGEAEPAFAPAKAIQLSADGGGDHDPQLRFENLRSNHSAVISSTNSTSVSGFHNSTS